MRTLVHLSASGLLALAVAVPLSAQSFSGTFTTANQQGGVVTVVLRHSPDGQLTGSMSGAGIQFQIEGIVEEGTAMGAITSAEGGVFFEGTLQGNQLTLVLIEVGAGNTPDYSKTRTVVLTRGGAADAPPAPVGNPLAAGPADPAAGTWAGDGMEMALTGGGGRYQGTLRFQDNEFPVSATGQQGRLSGSFVAGGQTYPFTATIEGQQMSLESGGTRYTLARQGQAGPVNPLAGGAPAGRPAAGSGDLLGRWSCQTPQGQAQLTFLSDRELVYNGERSPYERGDGLIRVPGEWGVEQYRYAVNGDDLTVTNPDGSVTRCRRQQGGAAGAAGGGLEALLQGPRCAYSSSPDGGYSTLYKLYFDGQGRFVSGTESSYSGDPGYAYGLHNDPNAGTYQVAGVGRGAEIYLTWPDGSTAVATVYVGDQTVIREFRLNGRHYGPGLCQ